MNKWLTLLLLSMCASFTDVYADGESTPAPDEKPKSALEGKKQKEREKESKIPLLQLREYALDRSKRGTDPLVPIELVPPKPPTRSLSLGLKEQHALLKSGYAWVKLGIGDHEAWMAELYHGGAKNQFSYNLGLESKSLGAYRGEDEEFFVSPRMALSARIGEDFYLTGRTRYIRHKLQMPGPEYSPFQGFERDNNFSEAELTLERRGLGTASWQISVFGEIAKIGGETAIRRQSIKDSTAGGVFSLESGHWKLSGRLIYEDMEDYFSRSYGDAGLVYADIPLGRRWTLSLGGRAFLFESLQARFAPYAEFRATLSPRDTIAFIVDGEHSVIDFEQTYLHKNYVAVNTAELVPQGQTLARIVYSRSFAKGFDLTASVFFRREQDTMLWDYDRSTNLVKPFIADRTDFSGGSAKLHWAILNRKTMGLDLYCEYRYEDWSKYDDRVEVIPYAPRHNASMGLVWRPFRKIDAAVNREIMFDLSFKYVGERYDDIDAPRLLTDFFVTNLEVSIRYSEKFKIFIRGENILDREYYLVRGYPERRAAIMAGVELHF